jgi:predicted esterase
LCRWAVQKSVQFDQLIIWAGIIPPDLNFDLGREHFHDKSIVITYGKEDPYIKEDHLKEQRTAIQNLGISPKEIIFDGGHDIDPETLSRISEISV